MSLTVVRTRYEQAADRAVGWLATRLGDDGSYGPEVDDLAGYYRPVVSGPCTVCRREASRGTPYLAGALH
jgi:hypothetical protein